MGGKRQRTAGTNTPHLGLMEVLVLLDHYQRSFALNDSSSQDFFERSVVKKGDVLAPALCSLVVNVRLSEMAVVLLSGLFHRHTFIFPLFEETQHLQ